MRECERKVSELRERVKRQQATIRCGRAEAGSLRCDADQLRREADSFCLQGAASRQLHGDRGRHGNQGHRHLLERANANQREAMRREQDAEDSERNATEGEMNVGQLCDLLLAQGRERDVVQQDRLLEERRVAEMAEKLATYKREVANCETASREMRQDEARFEQMVYKLEEEAEKATKVAEVAEQEANRLEGEVREKEDE